MIVLYRVVHIVLSSGVFKGNVDPNESSVPCTDNGASGARTTNAPDHAVEESNTQRGSATTQDPPTMVIIVSDNADAIDPAIRTHVKTGPDHSARNSVRSSTANILIFLISPKTRIGFQKIPG